MTRKQKIEAVREFFETVDAVDLNSEFFMQLRTLLSTFSNVDLEEVASENIPYLSELAKNRLDFLRSYH